MAIATVRVLCCTGGMWYSTTVKPVFSGHSKRRPKCFEDRLSLNAGQKYCRMLQGEHSAIRMTFIKLPFVIKSFVLSFFEWLFHTGFTVLYRWPAHSATRTGEMLILLLTHSRCDIHVAGIIRLSLACQHRLSQHMRY